jgi:hypothetical protein
MATYTYPDSTELREIEQDLIPEMEADDPVFFKDLFPTENADTYKLEWEQLDNFSGLQQARGLDGQPSRVQRIGSTRFVTEPGAYGEFVDIDEKELTTRAAFAKYTGTIDVTDLTMLSQRQLLQRRVDRQRFLGWSLLTTGQFSVAAPNGGYEHRDRYNFGTIVASPSFSSAGSATPYQFFRALCLQGRGTSSAFDARSTCFVNQVTANKIMNTTDIRQVLRVGGGNSLNRLSDFNEILKGEGLPTIVIYDKGYSTGANTIATFVPFIPDNVGVLVGKRTNNAALGAYRLTLNVHNNFEPGAYQIVKNTYGTDVPGVAVCQVHDGHSGGPVVFFASGVKILQL